jgi:hypothetical protein
VLIRIQTRLAALAVIVTVGVTRVTHGDLTAARDAARTAVLELAGFSALPAVIDRVGWDLTAIFCGLITVAVAIVATG